MVDEQNVEGSVQNNSETPQVMNEQAVAPENTPVEPVKSQWAKDALGSQEVVAAEAKIDPDENILIAMFDNGKTEVITGELISAGFDTSRMAQYAFEVGSFRLSRLTLLEPYKIEKKQ